MHKSTFFFDAVILLKGMKSWLQKDMTLKKLEFLPKKEQVVCHKQLYKQFFLKHLNCSYVKEFHEIYLTWYSYIGLKVSRGLFHLKLLRLLMKKKVISNL